MGEVLAFTATISVHSRNPKRYKIVVPTTIPPEKLEKLVGKEVIVIIYEKSGAESNN